MNTTDRAPLHVPQTDRFRGSKFNPDATVVEIAKAIRADIKAAVTGMRLCAAKYSVKIQRFSMGQSITIRATDLPFTAEGADGRKTAEAVTVAAVLSAIGEAYNRTESDIQSDYYACRFFLHVYVDAAPAVEVG